jgi:hypothetical protein
MKYGVYSHGMKLIKEFKQESGLAYFARMANDKKGASLVEKLEKKLSKRLPIG